MHINIGSLKPIACSKCGSLNAVKPLNEQGVDIRCLDCGHQKLAAPPATRDMSASTSSWPMPKENENPTF